MVHDRGTDPALLSGGLDKNLAEEICAVACRALQPADIGAVERDDPNLRHVPLAAEARDLHGPVEFQFTVNALHFGEIEPLAIVEVLGQSRAKSHIHGAPAWLSALPTRTSLDGRKISRWRCG